MKSLIFTLLFLSTAHLGAAADGEYTGQFDKTLVVNPESLERVILKSVTMQQLKGKIAVPEDAHLAAARLADPRTKNYSILTLLVEEEGEDPYLFVDLNSDNSL